MRPYNFFYFIRAFLGGLIFATAGQAAIAADIGPPTRTGLWVTQRLREFLELYPEIRIELVLSDEQIAIAMRAADVAIWTSEPQQSDLIRRPLFSLKLHAYASSQYIRRFGAPQTVEALDDHPIISYSGTPAAHLSSIRWLETAGLNGKAPRRPAFSANSVIAMKYAIRAGIGIGLILGVFYLEWFPQLRVDAETAMELIYGEYLVRERLNMAAKMKAHTAQQRFSAALLCCLPVVVGIGFWILKPEYMRLLWTDPVGSKFLTYAIISEIVGILVIRKIANIKV
jgi:DNA-binding transcriptional LysR family regulator